MQCLSNPLNKNQKCNFAKPLPFDAYENDYLRKVI